MNSSGMKRGLAATAISALAVTGLPFLASSAIAAPGDSFTVTYTGPALNGGGEGALVILRAKDGTITPGALDLTGTSTLTSGSQNNGDQTVNILGTTVVEDSSDAAYQFIHVRIQTTTLTTGDTATFRIFEDDAPDNDSLDAGEARQTVSISTAGPLASIDISPMSQSTPEGIESGAYTVTLKDSAGRTTQLAAGTSIVVDDEAPVEATGSAADDTIDSDEIVRGTDTFTVDPGVAAVGEYDIKLTQGAVTKTATLNVTQAADLTADDIDIVTAADTWSDFGDDDAGTTFVRVDQNTIRFDFDAPDSEKNSNVLLTVNSTDVTFGGEDEASYSTTLDANGNGSITVTVDAASIQDGDTFGVDINGVTQTIEFDRARAASIDGESATYFCQDDAACTVTAVVLDQFGNPVTTGEVEASRTGHNTDLTPQRKPVGSDGTVSFTFTDSNTVDGGEDTVKFEYFEDQFDNTFDLTNSSTKIKYSATGQGSDYVISLDGENTEGATYDADDAAIIPLWDTVADEDGVVVAPETSDDGDEDAVITITDGEPNQAVTLSVDNGALILEDGETDLSEGSASVEATLDALGELPTGYRVIGTKSGLVTLTVDSAGRTETAPLTVLAQDDVDSARNVTLTAPATVPSGTNQITFTAVVTDAFGNPVPGVDTSIFNKQVSGPGFFQDGDSQTDANGALDLNVRVDSGASGDVTLTVNGADWFGQFGADEDRLTSASTTDDGEGLAASSDVASATSTVEAPAPEKVSPELVLNGKNNGTKADRLKADAVDAAAGADVVLKKKTANGWKKVASGVLNSMGNKVFKVADKNGNKKTTYKAVVKPTEATTKDSDTKTVR